MIHPPKQDESQISLQGNPSDSGFRRGALGTAEDGERIIIANPSTYVLPTTAEDASYGYGGLPEPEADEWMRAYLAAPILVFLGSEDTGKRT